MATERCRTMCRQRGRQQVALLDAGTAVVVDSDEVEALQADRFPEKRGHRTKTDAPETLAGERSCQRCEHRLVGGPESRPMDLASEGCHSRDAA